MEKNVSTNSSRVMNVERCFRCNSASDLANDTSCLQCLNNTNNDVSSNYNNQHYDTSYSSINVTKLSNLCENNKKVIKKMEVQAQAIINTISN